MKSEIFFILYSIGLIAGLVIGLTSDKFSTLIVRLCVFCSILTIAGLIIHRLGI